MSEATDYAALVAQAEKAVSGVKDPELKRIAFQKVLDELLAGGGASSQAVRKNGPARTSPRRPAAKSAKKATGPKAYILEMADDAFFKKPKTMAEVRDELSNRGHHIPRTSLSGPLQNLCRDKILRRQKLSTSGSKKSFAYSNY